MIKYRFEERENWIKLFQPNFQNQTWHNDKVFHPSEIENFQFFKPYKNYTAFINPKKITGIEYGFGYNCPAYGEKNIDWLYMLHWLKRLDRVIDNFQTVEDLTKHIHRNTDNKVVKKFGSKYFTTSGQHRLCLAKYLEIEKVEVYIIEYKLDKELFIREKTVEKLYKELVALKLVVGKYKYDIHTQFIGVNLCDDYFILDKSLLKQLLSRFKILKKSKLHGLKNIFKSFYNSTSDNRVFRKFDELYSLDYKIIKHLKRL